MLKITCNGKVRYVKNIKICKNALGCSLVNDGHDDLYDQAIYDEDFDSDRPLFIEEDDRDLGKKVE